jgi:hypothetical protein
MALVDADATVMDHYEQSVVVGTRLEHKGRICAMVEIGVMHAVGAGLSDSYPDALRDSDLDSKLLAER